MLCSNTHFPDPPIPTVAPAGGQLLHFLRGPLPVDTLLSIYSPVASSGSSRTGERIPPSVYQVLTQCHSSRSQHCSLAALNGAKLPQRVHMPTSRGLQHWLLLLSQKCFNTPLVGCL